MSKKMIDPFGITDKLLDPGTPETSKSGFGALPSDIQNKFRNIAESGQALIDNPNQYFAPMGLTEEEQLAGSMIGPEGFQQGVSQYLNPFRDIITQDINTAFRDPSSMIRQRASEAGAFGGSRQRGAEADLERARLDAIAAAQGGQFNQAANQYQQGISNLLGFGGLERGLDLSQRQALPSALSSYANLLNPMLGGSTSTGAVEGPLDKIAQLASGVGSAMAAFSDKRLKENIRFIGKSKGHKLYKFNYINGNKTFIGVMAQEVEKYAPEAVKDIYGYLAVDYSKLGLQMMEA